MEAKQAQSGASDWFASWFLGECYKAPATEGELSLEDTNGKNKAGKDAQGLSAPAGIVGASSRGPKQAQESPAGMKRYLIDNSALKSDRPGVSFRHCKEEAKKVKGKTAPWGEMVDGTDEGDGWLKVGLHYLPMAVQDKPVVILVEGQDDVARPEKLSESASSPKHAESEKPLQEAEHQKKASKELQGPPAPTRPSEPQQSDLAAKRYLIDNSALQSNRNGVAFRRCKDKSQKMKELRGPSWGEVVEGIDEGDGWLKVGLHYLPMTRKGKPIITLVDGPDLPAKTKEDNDASENGMVSSPEQQGITEIEKPGAGLDEPKKPVCSAEDKDADALVKPAEHPQRAWFVQPSVGTWLQVLPRVVTEDLVVEDLPMYVEAPPMKWEHFPSVGTWVHTHPIGIAAHPKVAETKLQDLLQ